jgi:hypothetical protein
VVVVDLSQTTLAPLLTPAAGAGHKAGNGVALVPEASLLPAKDGAGLPAPAGAGVSVVLVVSGVAWDAHGQVRVVCPAPFSFGAHLNAAVSLSRWRAWR